jgi:hypothetical protein
MGINIEFDPDLALRDISEFKNGNRKKEECIPEDLKEGEVYEFLKNGQRVYWLSDSEFWSKGEMPLCKTTGNEKLARPFASIKMLEVTHFLENEKVWTRGKYKVVEIFDPEDSEIKFEGHMRVNKKT